MRRYYPAVLVLFSLLFASRALSFDVSGMYDMKEFDGTMVIKALGDSAFVNIVTVHPNTLNTCQLEVSGPIDVVNSTLKTGSCSQIFNEEKEALRRF